MDSRYRMAGHEHDGGELSRQSVEPAGCRYALGLLRVGYTLLALIAGSDKFTGLLTDWEQYLAPAITNRLPVDPHTFMLGVGAIEIAAGLLTAILPRLGGAVIALWLWAIIANLLLIPDFFDIALRDAGLALGALALSLLASERHRHGGHRRVRHHVVRRDAAPISAAPITTEPQPAYPKA